MSKQNNDQQRLDFGICGGVTFGCGLGITFGKLALTIDPSIAVGVVFGMALARKHATNPGGGGRENNVGDV